MSNNAHSSLINLPNNDVPDYIWINEVDGDHLGPTSFDNNYDEVEERNDTIENIRYAEEGEGWSKRYKYMKKDKNGVYVYRSFRHQQQFLKEVQRRVGLEKSSTALSKDRVTDDYFRSGLEEVYG